MATIGDLFMRVLPEMGGFEGEVKRSAQAAGDSAGQTMSQRIGSSLRSAAPKILAGVGAASVAAFTAGAVVIGQLDSAMADFRAETGATDEEVRTASESILRLSRNNLQSIEEIAAAQAALRTDLGLTQEQAEGASQTFLDYATATGQDAADGVRQFDDILDAWNLDASESQGLMDKLIASHQQYGGDVGANADALSALAPQLQGMNMNVDDGIALLNLFAASGLDAQSASTALNTAIRKLEPGQTFEDLVEEISSIEDPTARSQRAIEIFGSRGGVSLAQALRPGIDSLDDFGISQEEAQGKTEDAADAVESSWGNRVKLWIKNVSGLAGEFLMNFGPAISGVGAMVPMLAGPLGGLFKTMGVGAVAVIPQLVGAVGGIGKAFTALAFGPVGIIVAAIAGLFLAWQTNFLGIQDIVKNVFGWLGDVALPWVTGIFDAIASAVSTAIGIVVGAIEGILGVVSTVASAIGGFFDFITGGSETAKSQINSVQTKTVPIAATDPKMREYQTGAWRVPQTGPAFLHADEMVVPPGAAQALRDWFGGNAFSMVAAADGGGGGDNITIYAEGLVRARNTSEIASGVRNVRHLKGLRRGRRFDNE